LDCRIYKEIISEKIVEFKKAKIKFDSKKKIKSGKYKKNIFSSINKFLMDEKLKTISSKNQKKTNNS
jgi:hypothetical protein